jgi:hypothetical protein
MYKQMPYGVKAAPKKDRRKRKAAYCTKDNSRYGYDGR